MLGPQTNSDRVFSEELVVSSVAGKSSAAANVNYDCRCHLPGSLLGIVGIRTEHLSYRHSDSTRCRHASISAKSVKTSESLAGISPASCMYLLRRSTICVW